MTDGRKKPFQAPSSAFTALKTLNFGGAIVLNEMVLKDFVETPMKNGIGMELEVILQKSSLEKDSIFELQILDHMDVELILLTQ